MIPLCHPDRCVAAGCDPVLCVGAGMPSNDEVFARSAAAIPGGVNSSIRAFASVGGRPYVVARAEGAYLWDVEGNRYVDLVQSYGAVVLGHAHPVITAAVAGAAAGGTSYGAPTPREMKLAEAICERVASCEQVRFMNSGTEATSTAVRLARGYTGRDRVVIFHGNFHGATDALLAAGGSGVATLGLPGTAGVPTGAVAETLVVPYNQVPTLDDGGSCIGIVLTDIPLDARQCERVARRVGLGLARVGSIAHHASGDIFLAASTANRRTRGATGYLDIRIVEDTELEPVFAAVVDATEEAVVNALFVADTVVGVDGHRVPGLPVERVLELIGL